MEEKWLLQNGYVGNSVLWWKRGMRGYTTNIDKAHIFTEEEAFSQHKVRNEDKPWPLTVVLEESRRVFEPSNSMTDFKDIWDLWV